MRIAFSLFLLIFTFSCAKNQARYPLNKKKDAFLNNSAERNKTLLAREEYLLKTAAKKDSSLSYQVSEAGFLYAYIKTSDAKLPLPSKGTKVRFQYQIEDLDKNILYDKSTLGTIDYAIDQEDLLPGLREGLRMMRAGEVVVFLFPSYLCYGYQGDEEKIGVNQPLRFTIERLPTN